MGELLPGYEPERPFAVDIAPNGKLLVLDREGLRFGTGMPGEAPSCCILHVRAKDAVFLDAHIVFLDEEDRVHTLQMSSTPIGSIPVRQGATCIGVAASGSVLIGYAPGCAHGVQLERLGSAPLTWSHLEFRGVSAIACDSGGVWILHERIAWRMRPKPGAVERTHAVELPAPVRSAATGPEGALFVLLEPGDALVRVFGDRQDAVQPLEAPLLDIGGGANRLVGCNESGLVDLTGLVPPPA